MIGVLVNTIAVLIGTVIGLLIGRGVNERMRKTLMQGLGLASIIIGAKMAVSADNDLVVILSIVIGGVIGETCKLDMHLENAGDLLKKKFNISNGNFIEGFITASLIFCVGAMAIVGSIEAGLSGNNDILFVKSTLDFTSSIVMASSLGIGVGFAGLLMFVFQGCIALLASSMQSILVGSVITYMTAVGGLLIIGVGINISGIKDINVTNMLPGIFVGGIIGYILMMM